MTVAEWRAKNKKKTVAQWRAEHVKKEESLKDTPFYKRESIGSVDAAIDRNAVNAANDAVKKRLVEQEAERAAKIIAEQEAQKKAAATRDTGYNSALKTALPAGYEPQQGVTHTPRVSDVNRSAANVSYAREIQDAEHRYAVNNPVQTPLERFESRVQKYNPLALGDMAINKAGAGAAQSVAAIGDAFVASDRAKEQSKFAEYIGNALDMFKQKKYADAAPLQWQRDEKQKYYTSGDTLQDRADEYTAKLDKRYEGLTDTLVTKGLADLAQSSGYMIPSAITNAILPGTGTALLFAAGYASGERQAIQAGADPEDARNYALLNGLNQSAGELLIGGVLGKGTGLLDSVFKKAGLDLTAAIRNPTLRRLARYGMSAFGEGAEEVIQGGIDVAARKATYEPEAKVDPKGLVYEGVLGAGMGLLFGAGGAAKSLSLPAVEAQPVKRTFADLNYADLKAKELRLNANLRTAADDVVAKRLETAKTGLQRSGILSGASDEVISAAQKLSDASGIDIEFYNEASVNGYMKRGFTVNGKIYMNAQSDATLTWIMAHELADNLSKTESWSKLVELIKSETGFDAQKTEIIENYKQGGVDLDGNGAERELVSNFSGNYLFTDYKTILRTVKADRTLGEKIRDWISSMITKLTGTQEEKFLLRARTLYQNALDEVRQGETVQGDTVMASVGEDVKSDKFKEWFGDSKVVDDKGMPLKVWHGTNKEFNVFDSKSGVYWFSENSDYAEEMATVRNGDVLKQVYLNANNIYETTLKPNEFTNPSYEKPIIEKAKREGYDGIKITVDTDEELLKDTFYAVFSPNQIKSATSNTGEYSRDNPDIYHSVGKVDNEATKELYGSVANAPDNLVHSTDTDAVKYAFGRSKELQENAILKNKELKNVPFEVMDQAIIDMNTAKRLLSGKLTRLLSPADIEGNVWRANSSYGGSLENGLVCVRELTADALADAVADLLGRPLTIEESILISQKGADYVENPACFYCFVGADRKSLKVYLGRYLERRQGVIDRYNAGVSFEENVETYRRYHGAKVKKGTEANDTVKNRVRFFIDLAKSGRTVMPASALASSRSMGEAYVNPEYKEQLLDAVAYAQSASKAKLRESPTNQPYTDAKGNVKTTADVVAYDGQILLWAQKLIDDLNLHYGARMYSYSDFSPAFLLENMQMILDSAVRGMKMLAYNKSIDFIKTFAPTGMNINGSVFIHEQNGMMGEDPMMGVSWAAIRALRDKYPNVGAVVIVTSDAQLEWALKQKWIDVVIPYHLVFSGREIAKFFGYKQYTAMQSDKTIGTKREGDLSTIPAALHGNDKATYLRLCAENNLKPRFSQWINNPNYMKLVNETRQSMQDTKPVQPIFDLNAFEYDGWQSDAQGDPVMSYINSAEDMIEKYVKDGGYYGVGSTFNKNFKKNVAETYEHVKSKASATPKYSIGKTDTNSNYYRKRAVAEKAAKTRSVDDMQPPPVRRPAKTPSASEDERAGESAIAAHQALKSIIADIDEKYEKQAAIATESARKQLDLIIEQEDAKRIGPVNMDAPENAEAEAAEALELTLDYAIHSDDQKAKDAAISAEEHSNIVLVTEAIALLKESDPIQVSVKIYHQAKQDYRATVKGNKTNPEYVTDAEVLAAADKVNKARNALLSKLEKRDANVKVSVENGTFADIMQKQYNKLKQLQSAARKGDANAKRKADELKAFISDINQRRKALLYKQAEQTIGEVSAWKDKKIGLSYQRETLERNIYDIAPNKTVADATIKEYRRPIDKHEAEANKYKTEYRNQVRSLNMSGKKKGRNKNSERYAVQFVGEYDYILSVATNKEDVHGKVKADYQAELNDFTAANPDFDYAEIRRKAAEMHKMYDDIFKRINKTRLENGYPPVEYRKGYFPHFTNDKPDTVLGKLALTFGINAAPDSLPTSINGLTYKFKPGTRWFSNLLQRIGIDTEYDAVEGFNRYIEGAADVIFHTEDIQKLRALAEHIRMAGSDKKLKDQAKLIRADDTKTAEQQHEAIASLFAETRQALSNFVVDLDEYTNQLANKKARKDRETEYDVGRRIYNIVKSLEQRVAANMVALNPRSWLTNYIPLHQAAAQISNLNMMYGAMSALRATVKEDGISNASSFLVNRKGSNPLVKSWSQGAADVLSSPMRMIDDFVANTIVRARYHSNLSKGMTEANALDEADAFASSVMAGRSKGSMPTLFGAKNPGVKLFTMFQLEVNNQMSYLFKDLPREQKEKGIAMLAYALLKFFIGAYLFDDLFEWIVGAKPTMNPIGVANETIGDFTGYELPNTFELVKTLLEEGRLPEESDFVTEKKSIKKAGANAAKNIAEELPFVGGLLGGGRIPINSALPDIPTVWNSAAGFLDGTTDSKKALFSVGKELSNPLYYLFPPFGGGQVKRAVEGIDAVNKSGSWTVDTKGEDILQYPITDKNPLTYGKAAVFGKSTLPEAREWVDSDFKNLSRDASEVYAVLIGMGEDEKTAYDTVLKLGKIEKDETETKIANQRKTLASSPISDTMKYETYYRMLASETDRKALDALVAAKMPTGDVFKAVMKYKDLTDDDLKPGQKATEWSKFLDEQNYTEEQNKLLDEYYGFRAIVPVEANAYEKFTEAGLSVDNAYNLSNIMSDLKPAEGKESVTSSQRYRAIIDSGLEDTDQMKAFKSIMAESTYLELKKATLKGMKTKHYVQYLEGTADIESDTEDGKTISGSKKLKVLTYINKMIMTTKAKDALYIMIGYSENDLWDAPWHGGLTYEGNIYEKKVNGIIVRKLGK